jgi:uncharacterized secreted protein with C-terminal beta-propeller domain
MHAKTAFVLLAALASATAIGCGSSGSTREPTGTQRASLHRAKNCGELLSDLKADAAFKLNKGIDLQIRQIQACIEKYGNDKCGWYGGVAVDFGGSGPGGPARGAAESANDSLGSPAPPSAGASAGGSKSSATSYSETNVQVKGVDEADIVKNDGKNLYILHGRSFKVVNAWPANDLREVGSIDVEGTPTEMFVADGKVVVYSQVNGAHVFQAAGVQPKEHYSDYVVYSPGMAGGSARPSDAATDIVPPEKGGGGPYVPLTKVTVMRLDGTTPVVTREVYFEGSYLDARRVGPHVRTVLQGYQYGPRLSYDISKYIPQPLPPSYPAAPGSGPVPTEYRQPTGSEMIGALEKLRQENLAAIQATQLGDWLPYTFVKNGATVSAQTVACEDFYVPTVGSTESGMTEVASLDLSDPMAVPKETVILGRADTVYANADTLYLAAHAWVEPPFIWNDLGGTGAGGTEPIGAPPPTETGGAAGTPTPAPTPEPTPGGRAANIGQKIRPLADPATPTAQIVPWSSTKTHIHKFDFKTLPTFPNYVASGTVNGSVKDQFSLDDKDGFLRVATTENRQYVTTDGKYVSPDFAPPGANAPPPERPSTMNHLFVLAQNNEWLDVVGDVGDLAPNERIFSVRFVEHRGYVVTFRQVDPLFVIDLATPSSPRVLAALKIPGFSEYMHPLDANHILTIGRDATPEGRTRGLQLQIFDVTDGANPIQLHKRTYTADEYGSSEAEYDHKAFTFFADRSLLAFPYFSYGNNGMRSSLEVFKVDLGTGFVKLGSIDHSSLIKSPTGYCGGYYGPSVRRGVFLENFVYSISYGGIVVKDSNDLLAAGNQLALPSPETNEGYGPACY